MGILKRIIKPYEGKPFRSALRPESERGVGELGAGGVAFVVGDVFVHDAPQALDRVEVRTIGRDEMQFDPTTRTVKPGAHKPGVMIARVVEKHMTERERRIHRLDRFQQPDRRGRVDDEGFDHPCLARLEVDGAMNVDALAPARLFNRQLLMVRRPAAGRPRQTMRSRSVLRQSDQVSAINRT